MNEVHLLQQLYAQSLPFQPLNWLKGLFLMSEVLLYIGPFVSSG